MKAQRANIGYNSSVAAKSATGIGVPISGAQPRHASRFFCARMLAPMGDRAEASKDALVLSQYANSVRSARPDWRQGWQIPNLLLRSNTMVDNPSSKRVILNALPSIENLAARHGYIYVIESTCGTRIKIGRSSNPLRRLTALSAGAGGAGRVFHGVQVSDMHTIERCLHVEFAADRVRGEWFQTPFLDALRVVDDVSNEFAVNKNRSALSADSEQLEKVQSSALDYIKKAGERGLSKAELRRCCRAFSGCSELDRKAALSGLLEHNLVQRVEFSSKTRPRIAFVCR